MAKNTTPHNSKRPAAAKRAPAPKLHVVMKNGSWVVRERRRVTSTCETQEQAIEKALAHGKKRMVEVVVHDAEGRVQKRYVNSPADELLMEIWKSIYYHPEKWDFS